MFERYTDHARRAIYFACHEAQQCGSRYIEPEHLLLGLLHDSRSPANRVFGLKKHANSFRMKIEQEYPPSSPHPKNSELPLSNSNKRVLAYTVQEADRMGNRSIDAEHLVLGLLCEKKTLAAQLLSEIGVDLASAREIIALRAGHPVGPQGKAISPFIGIILIVVLVIAIYWIFKLASGK